MGGQGGCERRIEVFVKIKKKWGGGRGGGGWVGGGSGWGGQGGCERRIEVFVKNKKKFFFFFWGGGWGGWVGGGVGLGVGFFGGVRVDVNEEFKFLGKFTQKKNRGGGGSGEEGVRWGGQVGWGGQGGCERNVGGRG